jgi:hypothetical protein
MNEQLRTFIEAFMILNGRKNSIDLNYEYKNGLYTIKYIEDSIFFQNLQIFKKNKLIYQKGRTEKEIEMLLNKVNPSFINSLSEKYFFGAELQINIDIRDINKLNKGDISNIIKIVGYEEC